MAHDGVDKVAVFTTVFGVAYAVIYVICTEINLPLVTYHPAIGEVDVLWTPERRGPAMYWYGWMLTSLIGALALAWLAIIVPEQWVQRAIFFGCTAAVGYLIFYTAALFIYDRATVELEFLKSRLASGRWRRWWRPPVSAFLPPAGGSSGCGRDGYGSFRSGRSPSWPTI